MGFSKVPRATEMHVAGRYLKTPGLPQPIFGSSFNPVPYRHPHRMEITPQQSTLSRILTSPF